MFGKYKRSVASSRTHFTNAPQGIIEHSRMHSPCKTETTFNAGDIVPVRCIEVLPNSTFSIKSLFDIRQLTALVPSLDTMQVDLYAFFVPNRVVNTAWKSVQGENVSGSWVAPEVTLAPLVDDYDIHASGGADGIQVPPNSVADYYGIPTQRPVPYNVLRQMHELKFRGYLSIYNHYFRSENYQPAIPFSTLNVYNGFMLPPSDNRYIPYDGKGRVDFGAGSLQIGDNTYGAGAAIHALNGDGGVRNTGTNILNPRRTSWSALSSPLKANKFHDYFTSVLPSPQKGREVVLSTLGMAPVVTGYNVHPVKGGPGMHMTTVDTGVASRNAALTTNSDGEVNNGGAFDVADGAGDGSVLAPDNLYADLGVATSMTLNDLRMSAAVQQVYEILGTSGSRYVEFVNSFFGLSVENPFEDIPTFLGHVRRDLDLYQVAQTSQGDGSSLGNLGAFGFTHNGGDLFTKTFVEHGYVHIMAVVRHRNVYASTLSRDNFRMAQLDYYLYPLANIGEQPVYTREINPFSAGEDGKNIFGYQEAWSEYRFEPDIVTGLMRTGTEGTLAYWNYADDFDGNLVIADGEFLKSNSAEVLNRSIAISDSEQPQFKGKFVFDIIKELPMPTYSMPGLDIF